MLSVSVTMEYLTLSERLQQLENTISTSVETALDVSMASEELFTEKFGDAVLSKGGKLNGTDSLNVATQLRYYNESSNELVTGSAYVMSMYHDEKGKFPATQQEYNNFSSRVKEDGVYKWLFGGDQYANIVGSDYYHLDWYRTNPNTVLAVKADPILSSGMRRVSDNTDFNNFVRNVGCQLTTVMPLKIYDSTTNSFYVAERCVPTIANMGLDFGSGAYQKNQYQDSSASRNYALAQSNGTENMVNGMHDNFIMSKHVGKKASNSGVTTSRYYLTPFSLGITYVPVEVYKPVLESHIQQACLFNKLKSQPVDYQNNTITSSDNVIKTFDAGIGCIETSVYDNSDTPVEHGGSDSRVVNDGFIEYDLSTVQCRVDYAPVDFYNTANKDIVTRVLGSKASSNPTGTQADANAALESTVTELRDSDTQKYNYSYDRLTNKGYSQGTRIVARISTKVKVHIPYQSPILQWVDHLKGIEFSHHGIKLFDPATDGGQMVEDNDGLWFQYTTYRAISR